jgi:hypothetical protein
LLHQQFIIKMEPTKSVEIIEAMLKATRQSVSRNSFYFIFWGFVLIVAGIVEYLIKDHPNFWMVWPVVTTIGGIASGIYGFIDSRKSPVNTNTDRVIMFTWLGFVILLAFAIVFSVAHNLPPHALVLMLAGYATFITGGVTKFTPFVLGGVALELGAIACSFSELWGYNGLIFAASILIGYVAPGLMLRRKENG